MQLEKRKTGNPADGELILKNISITFKTSGITVPLNYQYGVQSMIYSLLRGTRKETEWHDCGFDYEKRVYKLFTFSTLRGRKKIENKKIYFSDLVFLDIRSVSDEFCADLINGINRCSSVELYGQRLSVISASWSTEIFKKNEMNIRMLSPVTVHSTEGNRSIFYKPGDSVFSERISGNFLRKYKAFCGEDAAEGVSISPVSVSERDKTVTVVKNTIITAWRGEYILKGNPEYLNFLYYCGIGDRNSAGFGMFEIK